MGSRSSLLIAGLLLATAARAAPAPPDPAELLDAAIQEPSIPYRGRMTVTRWYGRQARTEEVRAYFAPSRRYRWEFLAPNGKAARTVVSDGAVEEIRLGKSGKVLRGGAVKASPRLIDPERERRILLDNYSLSVRGTETVLGRTAWILDIAPKSPGKPRQELWIDQATRIVLERKSYHPSGRSAALSRFVRFEPGLPASDDLFRVDAGSAPAASSHGLAQSFLTLEELDRATGRKAAFPKELPGGFVFESAGLFDMGRQTVRHLRYTDGLVALSLFETDRPVRLPRREDDIRTGDPLGGSPGLSSSGRVLHWKRGKRYYTLVGDVSGSLLEEARSRIGFIPN